MIEYAQRTVLVQLNGGQRLRTLRESLGYRMRDVELASNQIAQRFESEEFAIPPSRLSDIETKGIIPSIFRLYSFAAIYRREYRELLSFYGLELDGISADIGFGHPQKYHLSEAVSNVTQLRTMEYGVRSTSVPFILWKCATDLRAAGARSSAIPSCYSLILCLPFRCEFLSTRRRPRF